MGSRGTSLLGSLFGQKAEWGVGEPLYWGHFLDRRQNGE